MLLSVYCVCFFPFLPPDLFRPILLNYACNCSAVFAIISARLSGTEVDDEELEKLEDIISSEGKVILL